MQPLRHSSIVDKFNLSIPINDQVRISPYNNNIILSNQVFRIKEKYQLADC